MSKFKMNNYPLDEKILEKMKKDYHNNPTNTIIRHALSKSQISDIVYVSEQEGNMQNKFSIDIKTMKVCNQKQSGRCWIFAGLNILREIIGKKLNVEQFELSQNYVAFYDKLEKINYTLNAIMEQLDKPHDDRIMMHLLTFAVGDGGQWDMFANIVKKYGIVPKSAMVETNQSSQTSASNQIINTNIRNFASQASKLYAEGKYEDILMLKDNVLEKMYFLLTNSFGLIPEKFDLEYIDKNKEYHLIKNMTPKQFFNEYIGDEIDLYHSITNSPTKDKPYLKPYTIMYLGNVIEGKKVIHLNLEMNRIKELIISQLKDNTPVWFGSDVSFYRDRNGGSWDSLAYDYTSTFGLDLKFEKGDMLDYFASAMNHAMVITGVNIVDGKPTKWKIENSWGEDVGNKGYFIMSDDFFNRFVYQAVILETYFNDDELKALKEEPTIYMPWDPMGTLAK